MNREIIIFLEFFLFLFFLTMAFIDALFKAIWPIRDEEEEPSNLTDHTDKDIPCFAEEDLKNAKKNDISNNKADV